MGSSGHVTPQCELQLERDLLAQAGGEEGSGAQPPAWLAAEAREAVEDQGGLAPMLVAFFLSAMQHGGDAGAVNGRLIVLGKGPVTHLFGPCLQHRMSHFLLHIRMSVRTRRACQLATPRLPTLRADTAIHARTAGSAVCAAADGRHGGQQRRTRQICGGLAGCALRCFPGLGAVHAVPPGRGRG